MRWKERMQANADMRNPKQTQLAHRKCDQRVELKWFPSEPLLATNRTIHSKWWSATNILKFLTRPYWPFPCWPLTKKAKKCKKTLSALLREGEEGKNPSFSGQTIRPSASLYPIPMMKTNFSRWFPQCSRFMPNFLRHSEWTLLHFLPIALIV